MTDRIDLRLASEDVAFIEAVTAHLDHIAAEVLAAEFNVVDALSDGVELDVEGHLVHAMMQPTA